MPMAGARFVSPQRALDQSIRFSRSFDASDSIWDAISDDDSDEQVGRSPTSLEQQKVTRHAVGVTGHSVSPRTKREAPLRGHRGTKTPEGATLPPDTADDDPPTIRAPSPHAELRWRLQSERELRRRSAAEADTLSARVVDLEQQLKRAGSSSARLARLQAGRQRERETAQLLLSEASLEKLQEQHEALELEVLNTT